MLCRQLTSAGSTTDFKTGSVQKEPLSAQDWNARLNPTATLPKDREVWIVTDDCRAVQAQYDEQATFWLPPQHGPYFTRTDGEPGCYGAADEILGWTTDSEDAEEAAALLARAG